MEAMLGRPARSTVDELMDACLLGQGSQGGLRLPRLVRRYAGRLGQGRGVDIDAAFDRFLWYYRDHAVAADLAGDSPGAPRLRRYRVPEGLSWPLPHTHPIDWLHAEAGVI